MNHLIHGDSGPYWRGGMGLHMRQTQVLSKMILKYKPNNIVEFGSGASTEFFSDFRKKENLSYNVTSFDHNEEFAYKSNPENDSFISVKIRPLHQCKSKKLLEKMFNLAAFDSLNFEPCPHLDFDFRAENCFYDLSVHDLPDSIDLVLLDGPNGNGRSISALHLLKRVKKNCLIMIDDCDHYEFINYFSKPFDFEILVREQCEWIHPLFSYCLLRIISQKPRNFLQL